MISYQKKIITILFLSGILGYWLYSGILGSEFWIIDDHNILNFFYEKNYFSLKDLFYLYIYDQDYRLIEGERFRPGFQVLFPVQAYFFQLNANYYKIFSLLVFIVFIAEVAVLVFIFTKNYFLSLCALILISSQFFWIDILNRIITTELWAIFSLIFFIPIAINIYKVININNHISYWKSLVYIITGLLALSSKESMIFLVLVPIFFLFSYKIISNKFFQFCNLIIIIVTLTICLQIIFYLINSNGNQGLVKFEFSKIIISFIKIYCIQFFGIASFVLILLIWFKSNYNKKNFYNLIIINLIIIGIILFEIIIYSGDIPNRTRYDFPVLFLIVIYIIFINSLLISFKSKTFKNIFLFFYISGLFIINNPILAYKSAKSFSINHVMETIAFKNKVEQILLYSIQIDNPRVVVHINNVWDYEYVSSIYKYLKFHNKNISFYLDMSMINYTQLSDLEIFFFNRLNLVSNGLSPYEKNKTNMEWGYKNFVDYDKRNTECVDIYFRVIDVKDLCKYSAYFSLKN
jgi:hypothetical protein